MSCDSQAILEIENLRFGYAAKDNLRDLSIRVDPNEFVALLGPNGSGKTTLMRCINRVVRIREGSIRIDGLDLDGLSRDGISKLCTTVPATIPEGFSLSLKDFVMLGRSPYTAGKWWESDEDKEIVKKAMRDFNIARYANRRLGELSSGEQARALLAKGVVQRPKLMMVDEPSAHLDLKYKVQVMEMLRGLSRSGITVIMASHDLNLVMRYCDKVLMLSGGRIVAYGRPSDVVTEQSIKDVFNIDMKIINDSGIAYVIPRPPSEDEDGFRVDLRWIGRIIWMTRWSGTRSRSRPCLQARGCTAGGGPWSWRLLALTGWSCLRPSSTADSSHRRRPCSIRPASEAMPRRP